MKHLGDVTDVDGTKIEPVDVITFGSPCQDMSIAGKRAGLKHEANGDEETTRSGLFIEAIRIIKEMRGKTNNEYPRFAVWENVPGAFSSNHGEDFRLVLEEFIKIVEPSAAMPPVPKSGWPYADCYSGDGWSLAYRTFDAQYWGVPQRRRRVYLVFDFRGQCAGKVLFEREGLSRHSAQGSTPWETATRHIEECTGGSIAENVETKRHDTSVYIALESHPMDSRVRISHDNMVQTLNERMGTGGNNVPLVLAGFVQDGYDRYASTDIATTLKAIRGNCGGQ